MSPRPPIVATSGKFPHGPAVLLGGPFDGHRFDAIARSVWLHVRKRGSAEAEWYLGIGTRLDGAVLYSHQSVQDSELDWDILLGFVDEDDDGPEDDSCRA